MPPIKKVFALKKSAKRVKVPDPATAQDGPPSEQGNPQPERLRSTLLFHQLHKKQRKSRVQWDKIRPNPDDHAGEKLQGDSVSQTLI